MASTSAIGDAAILVIGHERPAALLALTANLLALATWAPAVKESWVRRAARTYSKRLYEALDEVRS